ncbi:DNA-methyltransferase [Capnocytophaga canimorsus]|uniref:Methyltransferase n=1 Tax=Capnocytophaga canimorsus (strain 5) TaxID=860228 RepID=F9YSB6_CAPCC|nr:site-specific DNA-methyltransferase [Capnocytophaga canimorsus]AEK23841.1 Adenine-specific methyltransferase CcrMI [Capnocytophaga canimorsus Cc5]GIM59364.1 methyltransferase [Capnocytophaga canimorsus]GJQ04298.1 methyltransferase [Capnocytophaga canimorsus]
MTEQIKLPYDTIIQGDCSDILKTLPSNSIDLIFADPPYNMQTEGELLRTDGSTFSGVTDKWDKFDSIESYDHFCKLWLTECKRVLKNDGAIWVIGSFQNIYRLGYIMQDLGFWILNDVIWSKPNAVPNFAGTRFQNSHETLIWCAKSKKSKYQFNYKTMKNLNGDKQMKSVWDIGICIGNERLKDENGLKIHSTQKPEKLLYNIILSSTKPNDVVLDPFFGTGTTGAIAKKLGRHFIGIEREEIYIKHAQKRIQNVVPEIDLFSQLELEVKPPRISMKELITKGFLKIGQQLFSKDKKYSVTICQNGNVSDGEEMLSIHKMSAKLLKRTNNNGWDYFWTDYKGEFISIDSLRYLANKQEKI